MNEDPIALDESLRAEADELLGRRGLRAVLTEYGEVHVHGSYLLRLMAWRDLDIYLAADDISVSDFFAVGLKLHSLLQPVKMHFTNRRIAPVEGEPRGLYWGVRLGDERKGAWKIDIWAVGRAECERGLAYDTGIAQRLTDESRRAIIAIKSRCWRHPQYRREFGSTDIYRAVLDEGVADFEGFRDYMRERGIDLGSAAQ